jgi:hypothetical protein
MHCCLLSPFVSTGMSHLQPTSGFTLRNMNSLATSSRASAHRRVFSYANRRMQPLKVIPCVDCGRNPATVFLTQIIHGTVAQRNLCAHCAAPFFDNPPQAPPFAFLSPASVNPDFLARPQNCPAEIEIPDPVTVQELAAKLHVKPFHVIAVLVTQNVFITGKQPMAMHTAAIVCRHYGVKVREAHQVELAEDRVCLAVVRTSGRLLREAGEGADECGRVGRMTKE